MRIEYMMDSSSRVATQLVLALLALTYRGDVTCEDMPTPPTIPNTDSCGSWKGFTLIFIHFQKCGGTSVEKSLKSFATDCGLGYVRYPGYQNSWKKTLNSGRANIVTGHSFYGIHSHLPKGQKYAYVAVIREPLARMKSHYAHKGPQTCKFNCDLSQFAKKTGNYYVIRLIESKSLVLTPYRPAVRRGVDNAKRNLRKFDVVGLQSDIAGWYSAVEEFLRKKVGLHRSLPKIGYVNVRNAQTVNTGNHTNTVRLMGSSGKKQYTPSMLKSVSRMISDDYKVWAEAEKLAAIHVKRGAEAL